MSLRTLVIKFVESKVYINVKWWIWKFEGDMKFKDYANECEG